MFRYIIKLADIAIDLQFTCAENDDYFSPFKAESCEVFQFSVIVDENKTQRYMDNYSWQEFSKASIELYIIYEELTGKLLDFDVLFFHGVAVEIDGKGIIFTAPSGTGKSTHANLWKQVYGDRLLIINGDKPYIRFYENGDIFVCGSPWQGKENYGCNRNVPLDSICIISRSEHNSARKISMDEALPRLLSQSYLYNSAEEKLKRLSLLSRMTGISYYSIQCNMDAQAAVVAYEEIMHRE